MTWGKESRKTEVFWGRWVGSARTPNFSASKCLYFPKIHKRSTLGHATLPTMEIEAALYNQQAMEEFQARGEGAAHASVHQTACMCLCLCMYMCTYT